MRVPHPFRRLNSAYALCSAAVLTLLVGLPAGHAEPEDAWALESRVPASTLAFVTLEDVGSWGARWHKTGLGRLMQEPEMKAFLAPLHKMGESMLSEAGGDTPVPREVLNVLAQLQGLQGQVALAVVDVDIERKMPMVVGSLDFGGHLDDFLTFVERVRSEVDPDGSRIRTVERDGRLWWEVRFEGAPPVFATTLGSTFILGTEPGMVADLVAAPAPAPLSKDPTFLQVRTQAGGDDLALFTYVNAPTLVSRLQEGPLDEKALKIANAVGLDTVQAAAYGMSFTSDGFRDSFILRAPNADHGIVSLFRMEPYQGRFLSMVPAGAFLYEEGHAALDGLVGRVRAFAASIDPRADEELEQGLLWLGDQVGVDIEHEFLEALTGEVAAYATLPATGGLFPEFAYILGVKDPSSFEAVMERLAQGLAGVATAEAGIIASTRSLDYRGTKMHLFDMQGTRRGKMVPMTPCWARVGDAFVITLTPHSLKEIILRHAEGPAAIDGLAGQEDFQSILRLRPEGAGQVSYFDTQALMALVYDTAVPALQSFAKPNMMPKEMPPLDWALLPAARTVRPYLRSMGVYYTWNEDGVAISMQGPLPILPLLVGMGGALVAGRTVRMTSAARKDSATRGGGAFRGMEEANKEMARAQATSLGRHVQMFKLVHKRMPNSLDELRERDIVKSVETDPWGNEFRLVVVSPTAKTFQLVSPGADRRAGTKDDIVVDVR